MAYEYTNTPVLSKFKIGEQTYYLKDAEVRAIMDNFGDAVTKYVDTTFNTESPNLATSAAIATYLEGAIAGLTGAMHFDGVKEALPADSEGAAGDVIIVGSAEYVHDGSKWVLIGDEGVYATIAGVDEAYVKKTLTIAGIDLNDVITAAELKTALGLKALAFKDSASGTIEGVVTGVADAAYTPAGSVGTTLNHTSTEVASAGKFIPAGTVSAPEITVTPATTQVQQITSLGELPSYTGYNYTAPSVAEDSSQFASEGMVAAIDETDDELLVISAAGKASALTSTGFNPGNVEFGTFNQGALPVSESTTVVTGITSASATQPTFSGTEGSVSVKGSYDKATTATSTFTGTDATISHEVTTGTKTVTVQ